MDKKKRSLILGLVLGDGYIRCDKRWRNHVYSAKFCHGTDQLLYAMHKRDIVHSLCGGKPPRLRGYDAKTNIGTFPQVRFEKSHRYFKYAHSWLYPERYSKLSFLDAAGIALWYMDDGCITVNNRHRDGTPSSMRTMIYTGCKTKTEAQLICQYFKDTWDIKFKTFRSRGSWMIQCYHKEGLKFHKLIHPYIIPSMAYKQRFYYDTSA